MINEAEIESKILKIINKYKKSFEGNSDIHFHPNIPEKKLKRAIKKHSLDYGEKILFNSRLGLFDLNTFSSIITSKLFGFKEDDGYKYIEWDKIHEVFYHNEQYHIILDAKNKNRKVVTEAKLLARDSTA